MRAPARLRFTCAVAVTLLLSALAAMAPGAAAATSTVKIVGMSYEPARTKVAVGDTVRWSNGSFLTHTVTSVDGLFDSEGISEGSSFSYTFQQPGTYSYYCTIHPGMRGEVVVAAGTPAPSPSAPGALVPSPQAVSVALSKVHRRAGAARVLIHVGASRPGAAVLLELYSREHFSWRQVARGTLDRQGRLTFELRAHLHRHLRVVIASAAGQPALISRTLAV